MRDEGFVAEVFPCPRAPSPAPGQPAGPGDIPGRMIRKMVLCSFLALAAAACSKKEEKPSSPAAEEKTDANASAGLEPELAQAMAQASSGASQATSPNAANPQGPPPRGIFAPGDADAQAKPGSPPQITVGATGSEPRVQLVGGFGTRQEPVRSWVRVLLQGGPGQEPLPVQFELSFEEGSAPTPTGAPAGEGEAAAPKPMRARVVSAMVVGARVPPGLAEQVRKAKGSSVHFELSAEGYASGFRAEASAGLAPELGDVLGALSDTLATVILPYPSEPLGPGGFWMITTREGVMGLDMVTYRLVRVESVVDGVATLHVGTKRYAAGPEFSMAALGGKFLLQELQATGEGSLLYRPGTSVPHRGRLRSTLLAVLEPVGAQAGTGQGRLGTLQVVSDAHFSEVGAKGR